MGKKSVFWLWMSLRLSVVDRIGLEVSEEVCLRLCQVLETMAEIVGEISLLKDGISSRVTFQVESREVVRF